MYTDGVVSDEHDVRTGPVSGFTGQYLVHVNAHPIGIGEGNSEMRKQGNVLLRGLGVSVIALGLMATGGVSVSAQDDGVICRPNRILGGADGDGNGTVTIAEIRDLAADPQVSDASEAQLLDLASQAEEAGVTGIQYRGCEPDAGNGDDTGDDVDDGTGVDQDTGDGTEQDVDDDGVDQDTGDGTEQDVDGDTGVDQDTGDDNGTDDGDVTAPGAGDDNGTDGGDVTAPGAGDDSDAVTDLPETGVGQSGASNTSSMLMLGLGSLLVAAGAFTFRMKRA